VQNPNDPLGVLAAWRGGARITGNVEAVRAANAERAKQAAATAHSAKCPRHCGTIVRRESSQAARQAADRHAADPKACTKHPNR
jgi:hypothetical protein